MAVVMSASGGGGLPSRARQQEAWEYRLLFAACFPVFLTAAVAARLLPGQRRGRYRLSILGEARAAANTLIPYAFMG